MASKSRPWRSGWLFTLTFEDRFRNEWLDEARRRNLSPTKYTQSLYAEETILAGIKAMRAQRKEKA